MIRKIATILLQALLLIGLLYTLFFAMFVLPAGAHSRIATPTAPVWYFAEGRVGGGFLQWITVSNPNAVNCTVRINYYYTIDGVTGGNIKSVDFSVAAQSRYTRSANADLGYSQGAATGATLSATVSTPDCTGVIAERPMYFSNFHSTYSGTDVFGATSAQTDYYFADVPTGAAGESFLSVFNPGATNANVSVTYYSNGTLTTQTHTVLANSRDTFQPNNAGLAQQHVSVKVHSDVPVVVERPTYYLSVNGAYGSADVMGVTTPATTWTFAAGETTPGINEVLSLANFSATATTATVRLMSRAGTSTTLAAVSIPANSSVQVDVNAANVFVGHTSGVALQVIGAAPIVAQRELYSNYSSADGWNAQGVSDAMGTPANTSLYSFAEGFTSVNFNELLYLVNPTASDEHITVTLVNMLGQTDAKTVTVGAGSQGLVDVTSMVRNSTVFTLSNVNAYAVSMSVSGDGTFSAERVMQWNAFGTQGTSAVAGYSLAAAF